MVKERRPGLLGAIFYWSFVALGVPSGQAIVAVLAYRAISCWLRTLPGIAGYMLLRRTVGRWQRSTRSAPAPGRG